MFFWNSLAFFRVQWMLTIWSLVTLPLWNPACTSGSFRFMYYWNLDWRILSTTLLACEKSAIVWLLEHSFLFFFPFIFISWRLITLQYWSGFCHTLTWISHGFTCVPHLDPLPPTSLPIPSLWVFPVHQPWALVSCIQPGLVICFTLDSVLVSMLFSQNIPPSPSPTESKSMFCTSVSLFLFCI